MLISFLLTSTPKWKLEVPLYWIYVWVMRPRPIFSYNHNRWNWLWIGPRFELSIICIVMGLWFEATDGKIFEDNLNPLTKKYLYRRKWSSLATICLRPTHLSIHQNFPFIGFMSTKYYSEINSFILNDATSLFLCYSS